MNNPLCIYHGNCADGFGAALAVRQALGDQVDFHAGIYQDPPPDVEGRDVIMVDFSYKRPVLLEMGAAVRSLVILDHHKSAAEDLHGLGHDLTTGTGVPSYAEWTDYLIPHLAHDGLKPLGVLFDMNRSGAGIAWDFFHDAPRPRLIDHIEDRDLWRFQLDGTREIQAAVFSYPYNFEVWENLLTMPLDTLRTEGEAIERKHFKDIDELASVVVRQMTIGGQTVPVANVPYTLTSDMGHKLADGFPFAACYWDTPEGRVFSLRSHDDGADVSAIAAQYGGGGHTHAAGFRVDYATAASFERV